MTTKATVVVPEGATKCKKCQILMPIPGIVTVSRRNPQLCSDCAGDNKEVSMSRITEGDVDRARVQVWAEWRREGKTYDEVRQLDSLSPSYPTIKRYLKKHGFNDDGTPTKEAKNMTGNSNNTPKGWGPIERRPPMPRGMSEEYALVIAAVDEHAGKEWARVEAPTASKAAYLSGKLRDLRPNLERACRKVDGKHFLYFRLKPGKNGAGED